MMRSPQSKRVVAALAAISAGSVVGISGCSDQQGRPEGACEAGLLPGDLVITEVMANPSGGDSGREWFEIYNATGGDLDLRGVLLLASDEDGGGADVHEIERSWVLSAAAYGVAGDVLDETDVLAVVPHVDYGYADALGALPNAAGRLVVACGDQVIDEMIYVEASDGVSRGFTGDRDPDGSGNDDLSLWCDATSEFDDDTLATPGERNDICIGQGGPVSCIEDGQVREARAPAVGDVVITEVMSNPAAVEDDVGEWIEVYVGADIDLNGLAVGKREDFTDATPVAGNDCVPVAAGTRIVLAKSDDSALNGGLPRVDGLFDFSLNQTSNQVNLTFGETVLDIFPYGSGTEGVSYNLDPDFETVEDNDNLDYTCRAVSPYGDGDLGTPGDANDECDIPPPPGQCLDGEEFRPVVAPQPGDLVLSEVMANPEAAETEGDSEWFEVQALAAFDLNGLQLGTEEAVVDDTIDTAPCIRLEAGDHAVIAREADPAINGGLPQVDATFGFSLRNSDGALWVGQGETTLDLITWASVPAGASRSLDPSLADPASNDADQAWCPGIEPFGDGDLGTPGAANPTCGVTPVGTCNDGGSDRDVVPPQVGDLVITEVMPDPSAVTDANGEWFEVLVTADVDLNGLAFGDDPTNPDEVLPPGGDCIAVTAGQRVIFARNDDTGTNGGLPPVVATFGFGLTNGGDSLFVGHGDVVLDEMSWNGSDAGTAITLDPAAEDTVSNDDPLNFCNAVDPYGAGDLGTPGAQGPACGGGGGGDGMCSDGGVPRAIVSPTVGDLVITELLPNPDAVADSAGEWFEVLVNDNVDLNGLQVGDDPLAPDLTLPAGGTCIAVFAGQRLVFARNADPLANGGLPAVDQTFSFDLVNGGDLLFVGVDDMVLDQITWSSSSAGIALSLDAAAHDEVANDIEANFCAAAAAYGDGDLGTPGVANPGC